MSTLIKRGKISRCILMLTFLSSTVVSC